MRTNNDSIVSAGDMSASINSDSTYLDQVVLASIQAVWSGAPVGTIKVQLSNDVGADLNGNGSVSNWTDVSGSSVSTGGSANSYIWELPNIGARWVRLVYTRVSGTGTLNARRTIKG